MPPPDYKKDQTKSVDKWDEPPDARSVDGAGKDNFFISQVSRSGHTITMDDSPGAESVTIQHRTGTKIQWGTDGHLKIVAQNGQYTLVFGENRMLVTGAQDITVQGGGSLRVEGDYQTTVMGNYNMTVNGDMNITAGNMNTVVRGNMDASAKNMTTKIEGSTAIETEGVTVISSDGGLSLTSSGAPTSILSKGDLGIGTEGAIFVESGAGTNIKAGANFRASSAGKLSLYAGGIIAADGSATWLQSDLAEEAAEMAVVIPQPKNPNAEAGEAGGGNVA